MKKVFLARDTLLDRDVAVALIKGGGIEEEQRARFVREARVMAQLGGHPNVVGVYDLGEENRQLYMVTELVAGDNVETLIEKSPERRLPIAQTVDIARSVCRALAAVHSHGIVHRDLKPGNVYVSADGTVKIGDFGLAFGLDLSRMTRSGMTLGTVSYMTPEQAMGLQPTPQTDLYSLGAMLYEMLTGRPSVHGGHYRLGHRPAHQHSTRVTSLAPEGRTGRL
jgi:serine/threonine protein kinase